ncbi:unnamed protein product [Didymodactylos carnosus]|uniref:Uncharacterized protein n=1 Tax=Didymodactylos carnosus TaxID=1234261 RepID=A0A8S2CWZ3_9BILA|nr:unnamed protein product [Didymodactylos carnosus]CAF3576394.1 unnamed protein product [Didymodactylos carnosus]
MVAPIKAIPVSRKDVLGLPPLNEFYNSQVVIGRFGELRKFYLGDNFPPAMHLGLDFVVNEGTKNACVTGVLGSTGSRPPQVPAHIIDPSKLVIAEYDQLIQISA